MRAPPACGWSVAVAELLMADYGMSLRQATRATSLPAALALIQARADRLGVASGPAYADRAYATARERAMRWLREHYTIVAPAPR